MVWIALRSTWKACRRHNLEKRRIKLNTNKVHLRVDQLARQVGEQFIVEPLSFEVLCGDVMAVVGPSGSGKTSLLRLLNRLDEPSQGTVCLEGEDYRSIPTRQLRQRIGLLMQAPNLFPGTVSDNVCFGPRQRGVELSDEEVCYLLEHVGLDGYVQRLVGQLSGGEAQRVSLARTLANSPEILLLDEPTSALDEDHKLEAEELIMQIVAERKLTCLVVTHDMTQARRMADRVLLLEKGEVAQLGTVEEVLDA
ncbi:MAG: ATP-binding cassette domain-containing protein [Chloroflexi bacterium]|nr:MAG: ATP-binding cassette domain-containing protein [Chloroflexota bacterium]MBL1196615.1 ATP-binding cassette domain-containing protein [Chloroflexota bacterium]NOH13908.1 ATP-binding cassette domain-containing protein [Chloroflexota bacterium]